MKSSISRRQFLAGAMALATPRPAGKPRVAGLTTAYFHNSHADMLLGRLVQGYTLDGRGEFPSIELASLYVDQHPDNDESARIAASHHIPLCETIADALTLGTGRLAVDGVLLVAEHGRYPVSPTGSTIYPKRRFFEQVVAVFRRSGRVVPVFIDKHLADNRDDIAWIDRTARALRIPLMAGSVLPVAWRYPPEDVEAGARLDEILVLSYHTLDGYGFHALEALQALAERRRGGETGVRAVQSLSGPAAWKAIDDGAIRPGLLAAALGAVRGHRLDADELPRLVPEPVLWLVDYADGLRGRVLVLNPVLGEWAASWRDRDGRLRATAFDTREVRPLMHFTYQLQGVERMIRTGEPSWPVERTVLTSGLLDALLHSRADGGARRETPHLAIAYRPTWSWQQPPPPPPARPLDGP